MADPGQGAQPPAGPVPQIRTPETLAAGVYANGVAIWSSPSEFTIDFVVSLPPESGHGPSREVVVLAPQLVVARVKIPPPLVYQLMRSLAERLDVHERLIGPVPDFQAGVEMGREEKRDDQ